jgi:unsaturated rhamnogalacturonyl hydrolase
MIPISILLADTILARYPDPDSMPYQPWSYSQGYILAGLEKLWQCTGNPTYFAYIHKFVDQHVNPDGSLLGFTGASQDDMMAGTMVVAIYQHTGEEKYLRAAQHIHQMFDGYPRNSDGGFWHAKDLPNQMWIDGIFMMGMFLARYGAVIGERQACFEEVTRQILIQASHCRKAGSGLFLHAYDESRRADWADPLSGLSPEVWSEGLGWYALMLVETLDLMPLDVPNRAPVMQILLDLAEGLRQVQDSRSGLWYQVVDRGQLPDNWHDTSGSAMFTYTLQRAIDLGYINPAIYTPVVQRAHEGLLTKAVINPQGLVDIYDACDGVGVQRSYADYINYPKTVNAKEAIGSYLWYAVAMKTAPGGVQKE